MSIFSNINEDKFIHRSHSFFMIYDSYPVSPGHILIISKEEKIDFFSLSSEEKAELRAQIDLDKARRALDQAEQNYNIKFEQNKAKILGGFVTYRLKLTKNMSHVTCHVSCVTCHIFFFSFSDKVVKPVYGGSVINRATPSSF